LKDRLAFFQVDLSSKLFTNSKVVLLSAFNGLSFLEVDLALVQDIVNEKRTQFAVEEIQILVGT